LDKQKLQTKIEQKVAVIIVSFNSEGCLSKAVEHLHNQSRLPERIIIVDSASKDVGYLKNLKAEVLYQNENVGFCKGNNIGYAAAHDCNVILFLNPDAFLTTTFLEKALEKLVSKPKIGALSGPLLGYDLSKAAPSGKYDSRGIFQSFYGKWYDRSQGDALKVHPLKDEEVPALCGALMLCRREALQDIVLRNREVFDESFYMYKEDIDLSLRLRKAQWKILYSPSLIAYHCRGWSKNRKKVSKKFRLLSARNECRIHWRNSQPVALAYSAVKYAAVKLFNI